MLPRLRTDAEASEESTAGTAIGPALPAEPPADAALADVELSAELLLSQLLATGGEPEQAGPLGESVAEAAADVDEGAHEPGPYCCDLPTLSSGKHERGAEGSAQLDDVADQKKERSLELEPQAEIVALRLEARRRELAVIHGKFPQAKIVERTGIDKGAISRIFAGKQKEMSAAYLFAICDALEVNVAQIWYGTEIPPWHRSAIGRPVSEPPPASVERPSSKPPRDRRRR